MAASINRLRTARTANQPLYRTFLSVPPQVTKLMVTNRRFVRCVTRLSHLRPLFFCIYLDSRKPTPINLSQLLVSFEISRVRINRVCPQPKRKTTTSFQLRSANYLVPPPNFAANCAKSSNL